MNDNNYYDHNNDYYDNRYYYGEEEERQMQNIRIKKVNKKRMKNLRKKALLRVAFTEIIAITIILGNKVINKGPNLSPVIPEGFVQMNIEIPVGSCQTLDEIAQEYYNEESYPDYYNDFDNYVEKIAEQNNISSTNIPKYRNIVIPVIVEENNVYLDRINQLTSELDELKKEEWISYKIKFGDNLYGLAWLGSGDGNEVNNNLDRIVEKNNLSSSNIVEGQVIQIINPKIGEKKQEIDFLKQQLIDSLKVEQKENTQTK